MVLLSCASGLAVSAVLAVLGGGQCRSCAHFGGPPLVTFEDATDGWIEGALHANRYTTLTRFASGE